MLDNGNLTNVYYTPSLNKKLINYNNKNKISSLCSKNIKFTTITVKYIAKTIAVPISKLMQNNEYKLTMTIHIIQDIYKYTNV